MFSHRHSGNISLPHCEAEGEPQQPQTEATIMSIMSCPLMSSWIISPQLGRISWCRVERGNGSFLLRIAFWKDFVLSEENLQNWKSVALGNINAHAERETPPKTFCRTSIEVRDERWLIMDQVFHICICSLLLPNSWTA